MKEEEKAQGLAGQSLTGQGQAEVVKAVRAATGGDQGLGPGFRMERKGKRIEAEAAERGEGIRVALGCDNQ